MSTFRILNIDPYTHSLNQPEVDISNVCNDQMEFKKLQMPGKFEQNPCRH